MAVAVVMTGGAWGLRWSRLWGGQQLGAGGRAREPPKKNSMPLPCPNEVAWV